MTPIKVVMDRDNKGEMEPMPHQKFVEEVLLSHIPVKVNVSTTETHECIFIRHLYKLDRHVDLKFFIYVTKYTSNIESGGLEI